MAGAIVAAGLFSTACPQLSDDDFTRIASTPAPPDQPTPPGDVAPPDGASGAGGAPSDERDAMAPRGDAAVPRPDPAADGGAEAPIDWSRCVLAPPQALTGLGFASGSEFSPALSRDGLELILSSTSSGNEDLYRATRADRGTAFSAAAALGAVNTAAIEGTPFLAGLDLTLYFDSTRTGGPGLRDLYLAHRADANAAFETPALLAGVNSPQADQYPRLSPDGLTLGFTSARDGGKGKNDLWTATRTGPDAVFGNLTPVAELNGTANDESGSLTRDGRCIFFNSDRLGTNDLYMATRETPEQPFSAPINLVDLNTPSGEFNVVLSRDDRELFFSSNRASGGDYHVYRSTLDCP